VIELTIALHYVFNDDLLVWDVGHQHTDIKFNRSKGKFDTNRQLNGISGFLKEVKVSMTLWRSTLYFYFGGLGMAIASNLQRISIAAC
jgi:deoxyxylulose-5-phosphate synthase